MFILSAEIITITSEFPPSWSFWLYSHANCHHCGFLLSKWFSSLYILFCDSSYFHVFLNAVYPSPFWPPSLYFFHLQLPHSSPHTGLLSQCFRCPHLCILPPAACCWNALPPSLLRLCFWHCCNYLFYNLPKSFSMTGFHHFDFQPENYLTCFFFYLIEWVCLWKSFVEGREWYTSAQCQWMLFCDKSHLMIIDLSLSSRCAN